MFMILPYNHIEPVKVKYIELYNYCLLCFCEADVAISDGVCLLIILAVGEA